MKGVACGEVRGTIVLLDALVLEYPYYGNLYNSQGNDPKAILERSMAEHQLGFNLLALRGGESITSSLLEISRVQRQPCAKPLARSVVRQFRLKLWQGKN